MDTRKRPFAGVRHGKNTQRDQAPCVRSEVESRRLFGWEAGYSVRDVDWLDFMGHGSSDPVGSSRDRKKSGRSQGIAHKITDWTHLAVFQAVAGVAIVHRHHAAIRGDH